MSFIRNVRRGAAYEIGRRLWRWFAAFEIIRWLVRSVLPTLLIIASIGVAVWFAIRSAGWWLPRLAGFAVIALTLTAAVWLARRYRWEIRGGLPRTAVAAAVVALSTVLSAAVWWLR
jgi:hypothetical protein